MSTAAPTFDRTAHLIWLAVLSAVFIASAVLPTTAAYDAIVCPFRHATGLDCPLCGLGHSFCAVTRGDLGAGFVFHAAGPLLYGFFGYLWARHAIALVLGRRLRPLLSAGTGRVAVRLAVTAFLVLWVVRLATTV